MSHASVIVALSPQQIAAHGGDLNAAVTEQMEPFTEGGEWFADGSRWDWWVIGGRFTGKFEMGYDPFTDPRNMETCSLCQGTGKRNDALGMEARSKDPTYTCNGCQGSGEQLKYHLHPVGNVCQRRDLTEEKLRQSQRQAALARWNSWQSEKRKDDFTREMIYGMKPGDTLESLQAEAEGNMLTAYAFLRDQRWCESGRLGWFGAEAKTECEVKAAERGEDYQGRCLHTCPKTGAKIVTFDDDDKRWARMYWPRFIRNLAPETTLVVVDYHV